MYLVAASDWKWQNFEKIEIQGTMVRIPPPKDLSNELFVGKEELIDRAMAAWSSFDGHQPLNIRFYGPPGTGKNALVYELARKMGKDLFIINGSDELRPQDIACRPKFNSRQEIEYVASPIFAAMIKGAIAFFDEIDKTPQKALATLAPVLDTRRSLESIDAGININAHPGFLFCASLNVDNELATGLPPNISDRIKPAYRIGYPSLQELEKILMTHFPNISDLWISSFVHMFKNRELSPRYAIRLMTYTRRLYKRRENNKNRDRLTRQMVQKYLKEAAKDFPVETADKHVS